MKKLALGLAAASLIAAGAVQAQTVTGGGSYSDLTPAVADGSGTPFWDNVSNDNVSPATPACNIGFVLLNAAGATDCQNVTSTSGAFGVLASGGQYYSAAGATTPFMFSSDVSVRIRVLNAIAGGTSEIGYFTKTAGNVYSFNAFTLDSRGAVGSTFFVNGASMFGLYIRNSTLSGGCWAGTGCSDAQGANLQQHALFRGADGKFYVGMEDRDAKFAAGTNQDADYQDVILEVSAVPEPMSIALLATGLIGMSGVNVLRRRRNKNVA